MKPLLIAAEVLLIALAWGGAAEAAPKTITLPADEVQLQASELPGYLKARTSCMTCHSADYIRYQPPTASRSYWDAMVKRMKAVFEAPIDDADMSDIVDYLVRTYGAERTPPPANR
jgi:sulfite dehydrogenase (cytochrome) subunit B